MDQFYWRVVQPLDVCIFCRTGTCKLLVDRTNEIYGNSVVSESKQSSLSAIFRDKAAAFNEVTE